MSPLLHAFVTGVISLLLSLYFNYNTWKVEARIDSQLAMEI